MKNTYEISKDEMLCLADLLNYIETVDNKTTIFLKDENVFQYEIKRLINFIRVNIHESDLSLKDIVEPVYNPPSERLTGLLKKDLI